MSGEGKSNGSGIYKVIALILISAGIGAFSERILNRHELAAMVDKIEKLDGSMVKKLDDLDTKWSGVWQETLKRIETHASLQTHPVAGALLDQHAKSIDGLDLRVYLLEHPGAGTRHRGGGGDNGGGP